MKIQEEIEMWNQVENIKDIKAGSYYAFLHNDVLVCEGLLIEGSDLRLSVYNKEDGSFTEIPDVEFVGELELGGQILTYRLDEIDYGYKVYRWEHRAPHFDIKDIQ